MAMLLDHSYQLLLQYLTPADTAALRLVSTSWQAVVDSCLGELRLFAVTTGLFSLSSTPCLAYRSPFQHSSVRHHPLDLGPSHALRAIAGQFTSLHTLSVHCASKSCSDFEALPLIQTLRWLQLSQFSFDGDAIRRGPSRCLGLQALHLDSQQAWLQVNSLCHLTGLLQLQELVLMPRGYLQVPGGFCEGLSALGQLTSLTHLALMTSLRPSRQSGTRGPGVPATHLPDPLPGTAAAAAGGTAGLGTEGQAWCFSPAAVLQLSGSLAALKGLKVLKLAGVAVLPPAVTGLSQLHALRLERFGCIHRSVVTSLCQLKQLTALTVITTADAAGMPQQQQHAVAAHAAAAAAEQQGAAAAMAARAAEQQWSWMPLLALPQLQELVLGSAQPHQQLNITGSLAETLEGLGRSGLGEDSSVSHLGDSAANPGLSAVFPCGSSSSAGSGCGSSSSSGCGGRRGWGAEAEEAVSGYVCPAGAWSDMAQVKGLRDIVVVRSWHSAAITAVFPSFAAAVAAYMAWPHVPSPHTAAAAACLQRGSQHVSTGRQQQHGQPSLQAQQQQQHQVPLLSMSHWLPSALSSPDGVQQAAPMHHYGAHTAGTGGLHGTSSAAQPGAAPDSSSSSSTGSAACRAAKATAPRASAGGAVGVFVNHPNQGCFLPSLPQLMVLCFRPCSGALGISQRALAAQLLQLAAGGQQVHVPGSRMHLAAEQQGMGGPSWIQAGGMDRWLLLAQLRASMHPSKLLLVLGASATALTRLELTVDQSWSPSVLASLAQLEPLRRLSVLKLDCGRQQPAEEMWQGLSRLTSLCWLCLRWLDRLPVLHLKPLTNLVALQLKNIDKPPGVAQLAEALHGMQHLTALAIEGAVLDADEDWLRDMAGLLRHGRWTSSWVEHLLCREYHLRVLGSITAALLMSALLNSPKWPEMLLSALLAAVAGAMFVMAVAAALVRLLLNPQRARQHMAPHAGDPQHQQALAHSQLSASAAATAAAAAAAVGAPSKLSGVSASSSSNSSSANAYLSSSMVDSLKFWVLGGWLAATLHRFLMMWGSSLGTSSSDSSTTSRSACAASAGTSTTAAQQGTFLSFLLRIAAVSGRHYTAVLTTTPHDTSVSLPGRDRGSTAAAAAGGLANSARSSTSTTHSATDSAPAVSAFEETEAPDSSCESSTGTTTTSSSIEDPGSAFRRLRFLSLRRCTLAHSKNSVSDKLWQLSVLASQLAPGFGSQLMAVSLALVLWPLAVAAAISRIVATSGSFHNSSSSSGGSDGGGLGGSSGSSAGGYSYSRRSMFAAWAWGWDLVCGLLQGAANRVEGAAAGCGPVVAVASSMPELRFLDLTWVNLEPWELHAIVQLKQLHYLGLSRQQVGVVMSKEAVFARNCSRGREGSRHRQRQQRAGDTAAAAVAGRSVGNSGQQGLLSRVAAVLWCLMLWPLYCWRGRARMQWQQSHAETTAAAAAAAGMPGLQLLLGGVYDDDAWPSMVLIESPSGFDEVLEQDSNV